MLNELMNLAKISQEIGADKALVQGGGGNTSVKINSDLMAIKSSGISLKNVTENIGFTFIDLARLEQYLLNPEPGDNAFNRSVNACTIELDGYEAKRPSIETAFHAALGTYVIHTHSVYANVLTCSKEGREIASRMFPKALWVPYETPGRDLCLYIHEAMKEENYEIIFLENHGVIVSSNRGIEALEKHKYVNEKIIESLGIKKSFSDQEIYEDMDYIQSHVIFPDQVVYTLSGKDLLNTDAARETLTAYGYILETIHEVGLTPSFLNEKNAQAIIDMESEKYRQKILTN